MSSQGKDALKRDWKRRKGVNFEEGEYGEKRNKRERGS